MQPAASSSEQSSGPDQVGNLYGRRGIQSFSLFSPREGLSASFISGGRILIYGGCDDVTSANICYADVSIIDTYEPCGGVDGNCGGRGDCLPKLQAVENRACRCVSGFDGHDCLDKIPHERCLGLDCPLLKASAPLNVSTSVPREDDGILGSHVASFARSNHSATARGVKSSLSAGPSGTKTTPVYPPPLQNFGVYKLEEHGAVGIIASECKRNCNYRGICKERVCYCLHSYYGESCKHHREPKKGNFDLRSVLIVAAGVFCVFFLLSFTLLQCREYSKNRTEREMGYSV